jgi:hypothetical protein
VTRLTPSVFDPTLLLRLSLDRSIPAIAVTASTLRGKSFTLDGEAAVCGPRRGPTHAVQVP